jgi:ArsR family transcriptional regulator
VKPVQGKPDHVISWMTALSDEVRLRLLRVLERHELGVAELCDIVQLPQSTVSRHLKVLAEQGWIRHRRFGTTHLYRLSLEEQDSSARRLWLIAREQTETWATARNDALRLERRLRERQADSQAFFAGAAGEWDQIRREYYGTDFTQAALLALLPKEWTVVDLGCGTGTVMEALAPHLGRVIGVDASAAMLKAARKRCEGAENVEFHRADLSRVPLPDSCCDAGLILLTLTYVPDPAGVVREAARLLKPSGKLVVVDLLPHDRDDFRRQMEQVHAGFSLDKVNRWLTDAGLAQVRAGPISPETGAKGPSLFLATGVRGAS